VIANVTLALIAQSRAKAYGSLLDEKAVAQIKLFTEVQQDLNEAIKTFEIPSEQVDDFQKALKKGGGAVLNFLNW